MAALHHENHVGPVELFGIERNIRIGRQAGGVGFDAWLMCERCLGDWGLLPRLERLRWSQIASVGS